MPLLRRSPLSSGSLFAAAVRVAPAALAAPAVLLAAAAVTASAQGPHVLTAADGARITEILGKMTPGEKLDYIGGTGFAVRAMPSVQLPALEMSDGPFGTRSNAGFPSTTYAAGIGLAASWDRELASRVGKGIGRDARARGVHYMLGPGVNIVRSPRNGRNFEYFGEDPFLASEIALGYIEGMQGTGVSATIKHFALNNSEFLRHDSNSVAEAQALHELYLPTFEKAVKQGHVGAVMDSYNLIDGVHATANRQLNIDILRKEFGFTGTLMSDWVATYDAVGAANGGLDLEMPTGAFMNRKNLEPALAAGTVTQATIDDKVRHILTTAMEFGWLDRPQQDPAVSAFDAENNAAALESARKSAVLLKNDGKLLPLNKAQTKTVLVVGPDAYPGVPVGGGSAGVVPFHLVSPLEGLVSYAGDSGMKVLYDRGLPTMADLARSTSFTKPDGKPGLQMEVFEGNDTLAGEAKTVTVQHLLVNGITIENVIDDPEVMASLFGGAPPKTSSRRWTGTYTAATDGDYIVAVEGSGEGSGNRVMLDGKEILDNWDLVRAFQPALTVHLAAGAHKVVVEDKQGGVFSGHLRFGIVAADKVVTEHARELAKQADVIVVEAGFDHASESEGGDRTFALPFGQDQLIRAMAEVNPKTVVTLTTGGNVDSTAWLDRVPALLETWYAGQAGGTALAELLFGEVNPSGHLPVTYEKRAEDNPTFATYYPEAGSKTVTYKEGIFVGYRGYAKAHTAPLFPFGFGMSYTTFAFSDLRMSGTGTGATATFTVKNTGDRKGATVAQLYLTDDHRKVPHAAEALKGFARVELGPGETKQVTLALDAKAFAFYDTAAKRWAIDPGQFTVHVGDSVANTPLQANVTLTKQQASVPMP